MIVVVFRINVNPEADVEEHGAVSQNMVFSPRGGGRDESCKWHL